MGFSLHPNEQGRLGSISDQHEPLPAVTWRPSGAGKGPPTVDILKITETNYKNTKRTRIQKYQNTKYKNAKFRMSTSRGSMDRKLKVDVLDTTIFSI